MENGYTRLLTRILNRSKLVILGAVVLFSATIPLYYTLGGEFFSRRWMRMRLS